MAHVPNSIYVATSGPYTCIVVFRRDADGYAVKTGEYPKPAFPEFCAARGFADALRHAMKLQDEQPGKICVERSGFVRKSDLEMLDGRDWGMV